MVFSDSPPSLNLDPKNFVHATYNFMKYSQSFNSLPDDKILGLAKLKVSADDKSNVTQNI